MITQMTSWQVVEDGKLIDKAHLAILVDNMELEVIVVALEAMKSEYCTQLRDRLAPLRGTIPVHIPQRTDKLAS